MRDYLADHELEPRYQYQIEEDGRPCDVLQFGGCYLGRHLQSVGQIQRHAVEVELLTAEVEGHLAALGLPQPVANGSAEAYQPAGDCGRAGVGLHQESAFQPDEKTGRCGCQGGGVADHWGKRIYLCSKVPMRLICLREEAGELG